MYISEDRPVARHRFCLSLQLLFSSSLLALHCLVSFGPAAMNNDISKTGLPVTHDEKSNIETMEQGNMPAAFPGAGAASWDPEHRARVEKSMKRKLDLRCSLFVVIYIMNYLDRFVSPFTLAFHSTLTISTETISPLPNSRASPRI
jgi:hypothetical protein